MLHYSSIPMTTANRFSLPTWKMILKKVSKLIMQIGFLSLEKTFTLYVIFITDKIKHLSRLNY